jgi:CheY-like chemotaxis protein
MSLLQGKKVLLAEDNHINAIVITRYLTKWGMIVDLATDGLTCVGKAVVNHYDIILMDMQMPEMDGVDAAKEIRRNDINQTGKTIPIIAITANSGEQYEKEILAAGMNGLIHKPFEPSEMKETLIKILATS